MAPAVDPRGQRVADAIVSSLGGIIAGADYWYTPTQIVVWPDFGLDCLDDESGGESTVLYVLSPDNQETSKATTKHLDAVRRFDLSVAKRHTNPDSPFEQGDPGRTEIQSRLSTDVQKKLLSGDQTLGIQGVWDISIPVAEQSADLTWHPDWAVVFMRVVVRDHYRREIP